MGLSFDYTKCNRRTFSEKAAKCFRLLSAYVEEKHSRGADCEDEQYPPHLKEYIVRWDYLMKTKEDSYHNKSLTQSQKNRQVQDAITGVGRPAGTAKGTQARVSTRKGNERELGAETLVERGKEHNNPAPPANKSKPRKDSDDSSESDSHKKKKRGSNFTMMNNNVNAQKEQAEQMAMVMTALVDGQKVQSAENYSYTRFPFSFILTNSPFYTLRHVR